MDRYRERVQHNELLAGIIAATIANHSVSPPKKGLSPGDFMPSQLTRRDERKKVRRITTRDLSVEREQIADNVRAFFTARMAEQEAAGCK